MKKTIVAVVVLLATIVVAMAWYPSDRTFNTSDFTVSQSPAKISLKNPGGGTNGVATSLDGPATNQVYVLIYQVLGTNPPVLLAGFLTNNFKGTVSFNSNLFIGGTIFGNGAGLSNVSVGLVGSTNLSGPAIDQVFSFIYQWATTNPPYFWPGTITNNFPTPVNFSSNLTVGGTIAGNGSGVSNTSASNLTGTAVGTVANMITAGKSNMTTRGTTLLGGKGSHGTIVDDDGNITVGASVLTVNATNGDLATAGNLSVGGQMNISVANVTVLSVTNNRVYSSTSPPTVTNANYLQFWYSNGTQLFIVTDTKTNAVTTAALH